uniref:Protein P1-P2 n=1 Tax=Lygus hesperus TaxID=30085 RepID=A0A0A9VWX3_LYGHE
MYRCVPSTYTVHMGVNIDTYYTASSYHTTTSHIRLEDSNTLCTVSTIHALHSKLRQILQIQRRLCTLLSNTQPGDGVTQRCDVVAQNRSVSNIVNTSTDTMVRNDSDYTLPSDASDNSQSN